MWRKRKKLKNGNQNSVEIWGSRVSFRDKTSNKEQTGRTKCLCQVNLGTKTVKTEAAAIEGDITNITRETKEDISSKEIITINTNDEALLDKEVPHNNSIQEIKPGKGGATSIGSKDTSNNKAGKEKGIIKEGHSDSLRIHLRTKRTKEHLKGWIARNRVGLDRDKAIKYHRGKEIEGNIHRLHH